jgi:hypothetical protein
LWHHTLELVFLLYQSFPTKRQERCLNMLLTRFSVDKMLKYAYGI